MVETSIPKQLVEGTVVERIDWTERLFSLKIQAEMLPFKAGQFTKLALQNAEGKWLRRAYSLVNAADDKILEFLLVTVPEGDLSPRLDELQPGDSVFVGEQPSGFMTLTEIPESARDLWMLSTGTAIGPFLSMLAEPDLKLQFEKLVLVHAVRKEEELVYQKRIATLKERFGDRLQYIAIVSRENVSYALTGRIPSLLFSGELSLASGVELDPINSFFLICGNPEMVRDSRETLENMGYKKHLRREVGQFSSENYW